MSLDEGTPHCESPNRLAECLKALKEDSISQQIQWKENVAKATKVQLARVHDKDYINRTFALSPSQGIIEKATDAKMNPHTLSAALRGAGAQIAAVEDVMRGKTMRAFCLVRPPGHHASQKQAAGFSFFNNVAVGAAHALEAFKLKRVAIIDFDVHHGDGTEAIFTNDPRVMFWSSFQHPLYPATDLNKERPSHIKLSPMKKGTSSAEFRKIVKTQLIPSLIKFKPECIFISAGFDAHKDDLLGGIKLTEDDYAFVTQKICEVANKVAKGRVISTLEGGYNVKALTASVKSHVKAMVNATDYSFVQKILFSASESKTLILSFLLSTPAVGFRILPTAVQAGRLALTAWPSTLMLNFWMILFPLELIRMLRNQFKEHQHVNYSLKTMKDVAKLNDTQIKAFEIGSKAAGSISAHLGSFFSWAAYRSPKAFYAGLDAGESQNKALISQIKRAQF